MPKPTALDQRQVDALAQHPDLHDALWVVCFECNGVGYADSPWAGGVECWVCKQEQTIPISLAALYVAVGDGWQDALWGMVCRAAVHLTKGNGSAAAWFNVDYPFDGWLPALCDALGVEVA